MQLFVLSPSYLGVLQGLTLKTLRKSQEALVLHSGTRDKCCQPQGAPEKAADSLRRSQLAQRKGELTDLFFSPGELVAVRLPELLNISDLCYERMCCCLFSFMYRAPW